jgi:hypothetical protein
LNRFTAAGEGGHRRDAFARGIGFSVPQEGVTHMTTTNKFHMAGTEGTGEYAVMADTPLANVGVR